MMGIQTQHLMITVYCDSIINIKKIISPLEVIPHNHVSGNNTVQRRFYSKNLIFYFNKEEDGKKYSSNDALNTFYLRFYIRKYKKKNPAASTSRTADSSQEISFNVHIPSKLLQDTPVIGTHSSWAVFLGQ